uniref:DUF4216 domain-containing protein n=2 Tax=Caenorhabditis tropicalis TaxID=1561998 RepID=A0A1I7TY10_9PELO
MQSEEVYFWTKRMRPECKKDHDRNAFCKYVFQRLRNEGTIFKSLHGVTNLSNSIENDLDPFVKYSINKRKRWENTPFELLKSLLNTHSDMDVFVIERVDIHCSPYKCHVPFPYFFNYFPIRQLHTFHQDSYKRVAVNSSLGAPFKSLFRDSEKTPKVAIHIITPPRNFEKMKAKNFYSGRGDSKDYYCDIYKRRFKDIDDAFLDLKYEGVEDFDETFDAEDDCFENEHKIHRKYYKLEEHFIEKWTFVKVRNRKKHSHQLTMTRLDLRSNVATWHL